MFDGTAQSCPVTVPSAPRPSGNMGTYMYNLYNHTIPHGDIKLNTPNIERHLKVRIMCTWFTFACLD